MSSLETRFATFMAGLPSVESIDSLDLEPLNDSEKADYLALGRQIVIELKCITTSVASKARSYDYGEICLS